MTDPDTPPPSAADADQLPRHTTPTWEVEMLISGAAVFAMLQFPGWLNAHLLPLKPRFTSDIGAALHVFYIYLTGTVIILAITFIVHLILRARWIALVGMHSVFPDGVRWDRLRIGPVEREVSRQKDRGAAASIERADNLATTVFAFGTMLAILMLVLSLVAFISLGIAVAVTLASGVRIHTQILLTAILVLFFVPALVAMTLDRKLAHRMRKDGIVRRLIHAILAAYTRVGMVQGYTTRRLLESHVGSHRFQLLNVAAVLPVFIFAIVISATWNTPFRFGSYTLFPHFADQPSRAVESMHYDDQRDPLRDPAVAYIQGEVITGPYLKLVVPYLPSRDDAALRNHCPAARAARDDAARAGARLDCLAALHRVSLDGKPLPALRYDIASDPHTDRPALQAMIDVRALPPGRDDLRVARTPPPGRPRHRHDGKAWTIAFWR